MTTATKTSSSSDRLRGVVGLACLCASAIGFTAVACSSNSSGGFNADSGVPPFVTPGTDASVGSPSGTGSGSTGLGTGLGSGTGTIGPSSGTGSAVGSGPGSASGSGTGTGVIPSSGVIITVIPDGTGIAQGLLSAITAAKTSVHVEMYLLTNSTYINELIKRKSNGIDVKVVLNQTFPSGTSASDTNASSYTTLKNGGVDVVWAPTTTGFDNYTHEKTVIIDPGQAGEQAWIMTMNLDTDAPKDNREYLAQDVNSADVAEAEAIFEADYAGTSITPSGNLIVAPSPPNNCASVLLGLVNSATTSIDMEAEEIDESGASTETKIFDALVAKAKAGVAVRLVLEDSTESTQATAVSALQAAGGQVRGYAYGGTALDIHAKALVADGARAYVGSENFTGGSLGYNRELGVYVTEASEVAKLSSTIGTDFTNGSTYSSQ